MDLAALERSIRSADPGALLVDARLLRRVIKRHKGLAGPSLEVAHARCYALHRDALLAIVAPDELGRAAGDLPDDVILLSRPDESELEGGASEVLAALWRAAFHARVHVELARRTAEGALTRAMIRSRIHRIGQTEFDEIRRVLRADELLLPPYDDAGTYAEFAAVYLELHHFEPRSLERIFPTLGAAAEIDAILAIDIDAPRLLASCRPEGADDGLAVAKAPPEDLDRAVDHAASRAAPSKEIARAVTRLADRARAGGNVVRSALMRLAAGDAAGARDDLDALAARLRAALRPTAAREHDGEEGDLDAAAWEPLLVDLARSSVAGGGFFRSETRLLYDLQSACLAGEKAASAVDLVEWALSLGARPIVRPLPATRSVRIARHLRAAAKKLPAIRIAAASRDRLGELLRRARHRADENIRDALRPAIADTLREIGLRPANVPERVAADKVVEELLDRAVSHGYLGISHLRDALSRNQLKMSDLAGPRELFSGDALLLADHRLSRSLDGVYRGGEIYLRGLQKASSLAFGTTLGRLLVLYLALPAGAAFVLLEGVTHLVHPIAHKLGHHGEIHLLTKASFAVTSAILFGLLHSARLRGAALALVRGVGAALAAVFVRAPAWIASRPLVRAIFGSLPMRAFARHVVKPLSFAALAFGPLWLWPRARHLGAPIAAAAVFVLASALFNTKAGALAEEVALDWSARRFRQLRRRVLPGLLRLVADAFHGLLELIERAIYAVDERLRFREGESRLALAFKASLGVVWFALAYLVRFYANLLLEPQVNPIKHFPVVTVSHKIMIPLSPAILGGLVSVLAPVIGTVAANAIAAPTVLLLPGVFGFLVWELKENWRLYRATRAAALGPVPIGHHGETMGALMKPGFHSGTLPKLYTRLRRAARIDDPSVAQHREALHEVEEAVERFVERELSALLAACDAWHGGEVRVTGVQLGSNRVRVELAAASGGEPCCLAFEEQSGKILASVQRAGFVAALAEGDRASFENALAGLYALAGVDLVREQIAAALGGAEAAYDVSDEGLVVWPDRAAPTEIIYAMRRGGDLRPAVRGGAPEAAPPVIARGAVMFGDRAIAWADWVAAWEAHATKRVIAGAPLLPARR